MGQKEAKVVFFLGLVPDITGAVGQLAVCHILLRRGCGSSFRTRGSSSTSRLWRGSSLSCSAASSSSSALVSRGGQQLLVLSGQNAQGPHPRPSAVFLGATVTESDTAKLSRAGEVHTASFAAHPAAPAFRSIPWVVLLFSSRSGRPGFSKNFRRAAGSGSGMPNSYRLRWH